MSTPKRQTRIIAEAATIIAVTVALKDVLPPIFHLPQGGSVTAASMVPLLLFSLRRGVRSGLEAGAIYGMIHMALPGSYIVSPVQALLDYPIAFGALGLAGILRSYPVIGVVVGIFGRFLAHFVSGIVFFWMFAPKGMNPLLYSAVYNGGYLILELIVSVTIIYIMAKKKLLYVYL